MKKSIHPRDIPLSEVEKMSIAKKIKNIYIPHIEEDLSMVQEAIEDGRDDLKKLETKLGDILIKLHELSKDSPAVKLRGESILTYFEQAQKVRDEIKERLAVPAEIEIKDEDIKEVTETEVEEAA